MPKPSPEFGFRRILLRSCFTEVTKLFHQKELKDMGTAMLLFELAVQRRSANGTVSLKARIIFKRKKIERRVIRIPEDQAGNWDVLKCNFKPSSRPFYNKILTDW